MLLDSVQVVKSEYRPATPARCFGKVLAIIYLGVTVSDMVTFGVGVALRHGFFNSLKNNLFRCPQPDTRITDYILRSWILASGNVNNHLLLRFYHQLTL